MRYLEGCMLPAACLRCAAIRSLGNAPHPTPAWPANPASPHTCPGPSHTFPISDPGNPGSRLRPGAAADQGVHAEPHPRWRGGAGVAAPGAVPHTAHAKGKSDNTQPAWLWGRRGDGGCVAKGQCCSRAVVLVALVHPYPASCSSSCCATADCSSIERPQPGLN